MRKETLIMPKLGLTMESGIITKINYKVGDRVSEGESIIDFETDKLIKSIDAPFDGYVLELMVDIEQEVDVTDPVCVFSDEQ